MGIRMSKKMRELMEAKDAIIEALIDKLRLRVNTNEVELDVINGDINTHGSISNAIHVLKGGVGEEADTLQKVVDHINTLESVIMGVIQADRVNNRIIFMPKSGEVTDMEIGTFIHNMGLASKVSINEALIKLKDSVTTYTFILGEDGTFKLPFKLKLSNVVDIDFPLADGRIIPIIYYDMLDDYTITAYNGFEGDVNGRDLHLHYINFDDVLV